MGSVPGRGAGLEDWEADGAGEGPSGVVISMREDI